MYVATFHGQSYGPTMSATDVRVFPSIGAAGEWLRELRHSNGRYRVESTYADGTTSADLYPMAGELGDSLMLGRVPSGADVEEFAEEFAGDCYANGDPIVLTVGPRGGIARS